MIIHKQPINLAIFCEFPWESLKIREWKNFFYRSRQAFWSTRIAVWGSSKGSIKMQLDWNVSFLFWSSKYKLKQCLKVLLKGHGFYTSVGSRFYKAIRGIVLFRISGFRLYFLYPSRRDKHRKGLSIRCIHIYVLPYYRGAVRLGFQD